MMSTLNDMKFVIRKQADIDLLEDYFRLVKFDSEFKDMSRSFKDIGRICENKNSSKFLDYGLREFVRINEESGYERTRCYPKDVLDMLNCLKYEHEKIDQDVLDSVIKLL